VQLYGGFGSHDPADIVGVGVGPIDTVLEHVWDKSGPEAPSVTLNFGVVVVLYVTVRLKAVSVVSKDPSPLRSHLETLEPGIPVVFTLTSKREVNGAAPDEGVANIVQGVMLGVGVGVGLKVGVGAKAGQVTVGPITEEV